MFDADSGMAQRGTFIIDAGGMIRYVVVNPLARPGTWPNTVPPSPDSAGTEPSEAAAPPESA